MKKHVFVLAAVSMKKYVFVLAVAVCALIIDAVRNAERLWAGEQIAQRVVTSTVNISNRHMDGGVVKFSAPVPTEGYNLLTLEIGLTRTRINQVDMQCAYSSAAAPNTYHWMQSCDASYTPVLSCADTTWRNPVSTNENWVWNIPVNAANVFCQFSHNQLSDGGFDDRITVRDARLGAE